MSEILNLGKGHALEDSAFIEKETFDGEKFVKVSEARVYPVESRPESAQEAQDRAAWHAESLKNQYKTQRQAAYPEVGEGLDAFYKHLAALPSEQFYELPQDTRTWFDKCKAVKEAIPKE